MLTALGVGELRYHYLNARMPLDGSAHQTSASELESTPG
jgi:hypothetical protein